MAAATAGLKQHTAGVITAAPCLLLEDTRGHRLRPDSEGEAAWAASAGADMLPPVAVGISAAGAGVDTWAVVAEATREAVGVEAARAVAVVADTAAIASVGPDPL